MYVLSSANPISISPFTACGKATFQVNISISPFTTCGKAAM